MIILVIVIFFFFLPLSHLFSPPPRDLKTANIMMSVEGDVKLIDFGLCVEYDFIFIYSIFFLFFFLETSVFLVL